MKKIVTILLLALFVQASFAQEEEAKEKRERDINTIFNKDNLKITGGYLSPELKVGNVHEDASLFAGAKIGMILNDKFFIGLAGYGLTNNSDFDINPVEAPTTTELVRIGMGYGGVAMEYTMFGNKKVHFTIPVVVGVGGVSIYENDRDYFYDSFYEKENSTAFVVEPGINLELNVFKSFRIDLGASYRLVSQTNLEYLQDEDLSGLSFNATFKFGFF